MKVLNEKREFKGFNYNIVNLAVNENPNKILFVFPGAGYNFLGPLMYYPTHHVLEMGGTVITCDYDFRFVREDYPVSKEEILRSCISECLRFANQHYPGVDRKIFLGKSIGTQAMCFLEEVASKENYLLEGSKWIWMTPVFKFTDCLAPMATTKHSSLFLIGDKDPHFSLESVNKIKENSNTKMIVFAGADHSMDIGNNLDKTMQCHQDVTREVVRFIC